ncbi:hypothetical protein VNO78_15450 [Psophocarpus tetragonolobus]|uniref:Gnk2-homologous domain-containing protein n=1 Tax=Psophocarpus tetragonolobus TaxID=3891 RepID=A0AAN9SG36_PSOTE
MALNSLKLIFVCILVTLSFRTPKALATAQVTYPLACAKSARGRQPRNYPQTQNVPCRKRVLCGTLNARFGIRTRHSSPSWNLFSTVDITSNSTTSFMGMLSSTMNQTAEAAASSGKRFFTKEANLSGSQTLYTLAQCTQDLTPQNCTTCLTQAIRYLVQLSDGKQGGRLGFPSCNVWYELYPFYGLVTDHPPTNTPSPPPSSILHPPSSILHPQVFKYICILLSISL